MDDYAFKKTGLTQEELQMMNKLIDVWTVWEKFAQNENTTEDERHRFREGLHMIQQILADRALHRAYPDYWT